MLPILGGKGTETFYLSQSDETSEDQDRGPILNIPPHSPFSGRGIDWNFNQEGALMKIFVKESKHF